MTIRAYTAADLPQGSPRWYAVRSRRVGASETAAIGGLSPHRSPADVWADKTGRPRFRPPRHLGLDIGLALEPLALAKWSQETGHATERGPTLVELDGFRAASLDAWTPIREPVDGKVLLPHSPPWEGMPIHIAIQLHQQAALIEALTGQRLEAAHVAQIDLRSCQFRSWRLPLDAVAREWYADEWASYPARWWSAYVAGEAIPSEATCAQVYHVSAETVSERAPTDEEAELLTACVAAEAELSALGRAERDAKATRDALRDDLARRLGPNHILPGLRLARRSGRVFLAPKE